MAERALTEEAMLSGLHDIRLPGTAPGGLAAELLAAAGTGILLAVALAALAALVTRARSAKAADLPAEAPEETDPQDEAALRRALLRRLKRERPERFAEVAGDLYRPGGVPETAALRALVDAP